MVIGHWSFRISNFVPAPRSRPDALRDQLSGGCAGPVAVGGWARRAGVQDFAESDPVRRCELFQNAFCAAQGEVSDADNPSGLKRRDHGLEVFVAGGEKLSSFLGGEFVRGEVPSSFVEEGERAVIGHEMRGEETVGGAKPLSEQAPEPTATDFRARAGEPFDRALGMRPGRRRHVRHNPHPIADSGHLSERHAGLHHAKRPGIHAQKQNLAGLGGESFEVELVGGPGVVERVVDMRDRGAEPEPATGARQLLRRAGHLVKNRCHGGEHSAPGENAKSQVVSPTRCDVSGFRPSVQNIREPPDAFSARTHAANSSDVAGGCRGAESTRAAVGMKDQDQNRTGGTERSRGKLFPASAAALKLSGHGRLGWSSGDAAQLLEVTAGLYEVATLDGFPEQLLAGLRSVIPFEIGECHVVDRDHQMVSACIQPERPIPLSRQDEFRRLARLHPLNPLLLAHPARAFVLTDVLSLKDFLATEFYAALYRPRRVNRELVALLPDGPPQAEAEPGTWKGGFLRISLRRWGSEFSEGERARMNLLLPMIQRARNQLSARARSSSGRGTVGQVGQEGIEFPDENAFNTWIRSTVHWPVTRRESDVLFWLSQGKTNAEIGQILGMAERTAETHALRAYPKIGVENRHGAIALVTRMTFQRNVKSAVG